MMKEYKFKLIRKNKTVWSRRRRYGKKIKSRHFCPFSLKNPINGLVFITSNLRDVLYKQLFCITCYNASEVEQILTYFRFRRRISWADGNVHLQKNCLMPSSWFENISDHFISMNIILVVMCGYILLVVWVHG